MVEERVRVRRVGAVILAAREERMHDCFSDACFWWTAGRAGEERAGGCVGEWVVVVFAAGHFQRVSGVSAGVQSLCVKTHC